MTAKEIRRQIAPHKKVTLRQVQNYIRLCGIKPVGLDQRPPQYPENAAQEILRRLGLNGQRRAA